ncbi:MAG TPA: TfoX/Sxy family protein [Burkholderiaceae bacterium]|nr:TfoX/Sxy family protein [Burkholderiaceae bacterium]
MSKELLDHALELLAPLGSLRSRRMFGGWGIYVEDLFIAIIAFEQLFLKADDVTVPRFEAAGCRRFEYEREGKMAGLRYFTPPEDAMESPALMRPWAQLALEAALRARQKAPARTAARPTRTKTAASSSRRRPRKA